ncbi:MAG: malonate decarboxylase subunit alpha [Burkholderiaceae bacterium]
MKRVGVDDAVALIPNGATLACAGFVGVGHAEAVTAAIEHHFLAHGTPSQLTLVYSAGQGDRADRGVNHFGHEGLTRRIVGGHWRSAPKLSRLALENRCEAWNLPQGVITHLYRAIAGGKPGVITKIGLHTFVDPRHGGGKLNARTTADLVDLLEIDGEEWLRYRPMRIDVALIRATTSDARGNLTTEHEPFHHEMLAIAQAAHNSGGIVIAQVKRVVDAHDDPQRVRVPGIVVDYVVEVGEDADHHSMTFGEYLNLDYMRAAPREAAGGAAAATAKLAPAALDARRIVQRRALLELAAHRPRVVNLGVGMPAGVGAVAREEGVGGFVLTVESGPIGGTPADGLSFGASEFPEAIVDEPAQFDFYDGGGIDMAFLGLAEFDGHGNVNVSLFGEGEHRLLAGVGGFVNITQSTRRLVFMGPLTAGGLQVEAGDGRLRIVREGRSRKLVPRVGHLSFNGEYASRQGADVLYVTERAVFRLVDGQLVLVEIAPGIGLQRDVLAHCGAPVAVSPALATMDARIYRAGPMCCFDVMPIDT